jgi:BolA family transcriptional regulator, general stress-responsive regulator
MSDMAEKIRERLVVLQPIALHLDDESARHAGHHGMTGASGTHFRLRIVAAVFQGKSRLERQRMVLALLGEEFEQELHALSLTCLSPAEAVTKIQP